MNKLINVCHQQMVSGHQGWILFMTELTKWHNI